MLLIFSNIVLCLCSWRIMVYSFACIFFSFFSIFGVMVILASDNYLCKVSLMSQKSLRKISITSENIFIEFRMFAILLGTLFKLLMQNLTLFSVLSVFLTSWISFNNLFLSNFFPISSKLSDALANLTFLCRWYHRLSPRLELILVGIHLFVAREG